MMQRAKLGDPLFVDGVDKYQEDLVSHATADETRRKILDDRTQNTSAYDPDGLESLETLVSQYIHQISQLTNVALELHTSPLRTTQEWQCRLLRQSICCSAAR